MKIGHLLFGGFSSRTTGFSKLLKILKYPAHFSNNKHKEESIKRISIVIRITITITIGITIILQSSCAEGYGYRT